MLLLSTQVASCKVFFILSIMTVATIIRRLPRTQKETLLLLIALFYTIICCSLVHSFSSFGGRKAARKTQRRASSFFHQCSTAPLMALSTAVDNDEQEKQKQYLPVAIVDAMPEPLPANLKNFYYLLRHGQSTSNVAGVISSNAAELAYTEKHGLTELGRKQGKISANALLVEIKKNIQMKQDEANDELSSSNADTTERIVFVSSPFARARQTAEMCLQGLLELDQDLPAAMDVSEEEECLVDQECNLFQFPEATAATDPADDNFLIRDKLQERYFGKLDGEALYTYSYVWPLDKNNVTHTAFGVESVAAVCHRFRSLIADDLETLYENSHIVLVSHADVLQIAQLYAVSADECTAGSFSSFRFANGEVRPLRVGCDSALPEEAPLEAPVRCLRKIQQQQQQQK